MKPAGHFATLRTSPLFKALDDAQVQALAKVLTFERHAAGHLFARVGRQSKRGKDTLYIILEGEVSVTTRPKEQNQVPVERRMKPGEMFGLIAFLEGGARTATIRAAEPVQVASLTHEHYEQAVRTDPVLDSSFLFCIAGQLARDVRACNQRLWEAIQRPATRTPQVPPRRAASSGS